MKLCQGLKQSDRFYNKLMEMDPNHFTGHVFIVLPRKHTHPAKKVRMDLAWMPHFTSTQGASGIHRDLIKKLIVLYFGSMSDRREYMEPCHSATRQIRRIIRLIFKQIIRQVIALTISQIIRPIIILIIRQ